jgi:hypothetical protein
MFVRRLLEVLDHVGELVPLDHVPFFVLVGAQLPFGTRDLAQVVLPFGVALVLVGARTDFTEHAFARLLLVVQHPVFIIIEKIRPL